MNNEKKFTPEHVFIYRSLTTFGRLEGETEMRFDAITCEELVTKMVTYLRVVGMDDTSIRRAFLDQIEQLEENIKVIADEHETREEDNKSTQKKEVDYDTWDYRKLYADLNKRVEQLESKTGRRFEQLESTL
jgi:hypothetical protein